MTERIVVLGGTFDPIHIGHLAIAEDARYQLQATQTIFVPAAHQPLKAQPATTSPADRLAMTQLAVADNAAFAVSDIELQRGGLSYTVDTVAALLQTRPHAELSWIVGADAARDLLRWHQIERLLTLCKIAVVERPGYIFDQTAISNVLPLAHERLIKLRGPALDISASEVRQRLQTGQPVRYHLRSAVHAYIQQHALYRS